MDRKTLFTYVLLALCGLSVLLGLVLVFKQSPVFTVKESGKIELPSIGKDGIAIVYIYGEIFVERQYSMFPGFLSGSDAIIDRLRKIDKNKNVKAVVLRINSPGGSTGASQEIYEEVKKLRQNGKKIVVSMGDVGASGAYYISCAADRIIANPSTITGSIGVIFNFGNMQELFKKIGVKMEVVKSGKSKDIGAYWRSPEESERQLLQGLIDNSYEQFVKVIVDGRKMTYDQVKQLADGSIFTGEQALNKGLIDQLGNLPDAIQVAADLAGLKGEPYIIKDYSPMEKVFEIFNRKTEENSLTQVTKALSKSDTRLAYLME
ncbi:MAG: signal peptide peptidase SppA [bacterium]|nr:signal peptide peptidase SppA [bacterium]MDD5353922.1 signal peptide peptidase SppA [bacterium]MDD5755767.1 signal peptide peptidase SppA [bacterium]